MNAASAWDHAGHGNGTRNQLNLGDGAALSASITLSSPLESVTTVAKDLKLSVDLEIRADRQWLNLSLEDEMNLLEARVSYPILCTTMDRAYHLREALVIAMRRLIQEAFSQNLISDYPGALMTVWTQAHESAAPTPSSSVESMPSLTDLESL
jgi:hypothetical protein